MNTTYAYDPASSLTSVLHKLGTTTLDGATYTYDNAENRKTRTDKRLNTTLTYGYDNIYQLQTAKQGSTTKESYTYDLVGNRKTSLNVSQYNYNSSNELTSTPTITYGYDSDGNLKTKSDGTQYNWDYENRLTSVVLPGSGGTVSFKYDAFGRRAQKSFVQGGTTTTTNYLYDGLDLLEEIDTSGNLLARYVPSDGTDQPLEMIRGGVPSYYQADGLGSVSSLSNAAGSLVNTYAYDTYGNVTGSTGSAVNPVRYTGREFDSEVGIYEYRARYYDASVGRFLSEDPLGFNAGHDFYVYAENDPASLEDPFGLQALPNVNPIPNPGPVLVPNPSVPEAETGGSWIGRFCGANPEICVPAAVLFNPSELNGGELDWINLEKQRENEYNGYKNRCNEPPPPGLDPCALARWKLARNTDCRSMRQAWDDKWFPGRHANDVENLDRSIQKLKDWIERNCHGCKKP